ncbi:MAG: squalene--hopene cyclase [Gammaproteobacteria bacterium]|nr:squalene--hopene cyclase [Gammaproteobacteria bacterium]
MTIAEPWPDPNGTRPARLDDNGSDLLGKVAHAVDHASRSLIDEQREDGHWCYELEADCTIPSEYILMMHFCDEIDDERQQRMARYIRRNQTEEGGWPLYYGGEIDISCTVKAYFALKLAGDDPDAPHMARARKAILNRGGAAKANVFTRIVLAQFRQVPWRAVPFIPVEIMLLPRWFPFHLSKVAYWSRTVMVPLFVLMSLKVQARNPSGTSIAELFTVPPFEEGNYFPVRSRLNWLLLRIERTARLFEPLIPGFVRRRAMARAEAWMLERMNGDGGLGAIFPAMVNAYEALGALGYAADDPIRRQARHAIELLVVERDEEAYCQPCVSPIWDTSLASHALLEAGDPAAVTAVERGLDWLAERQITAAGDWSEHCPDVEGGGWAFQYRNDHYPDLDDTAVVAWAMQRAGHARHADTIERARRWLCALQSRDGGFAAFDADNTHFHLNEIPFADHGALLDPPTADVSARVGTLLGALPESERGDPAVMAELLTYLEREQEPDGSWFGRWGTNYIYGTWSVLQALETLGVPRSDPRVRRAAGWLKTMQNSDGGWGEHNDSYEREPGEGHAEAAPSNIGSTAFQTAWALLGLMAAGEGNAPEVRRGVEHLLARQEQDGLWSDPWFTAPGFPRVFYLRYHGYSRFFPLWALARYRNEQRSIAAPEQDAAVADASRSLSPAPST